MSRPGTGLKLRTKLFLSFLILNLIPLALVGTLVYQKSSSLIQEKTNDYTTDILGEVSKNISLNVNEIERMYYTLFTNAEVRSVLEKANRGEINPPEYLSLSKRMYNLLYGTIIERSDVNAVDLYSLNGMVFNAGQNSLAGALSTEEWKRIQNNRGDLIWLYPDSGSKDIVFASSIYDVETMEKMGYFILSYKEEALHSIYSEIKLNEQGQLYIVNEQGAVISYGRTSPGDGVPGGSFFERIAGADGEGGFTQEINGIIHNVTYYPIGDIGWKIISVIPSTNYEQTSIQLKNWMLVLIGSSFVVSFVLAYFVSDSISKPIRRLAAVMKHVEQDQLDVSFQHHSRDEIGLLSRNFNRMVQRIKYLIEQVYQAELLKQQTQLKYLMFQINPHFLFNTLETINWLSRIQGAPDVGKLSKALGDLMREGIKGKEFVTVAQEIENLEKYLYIQKYRYGDRITVDMAVEEEAQPIIVPHFILQPLLENAFVHGLEMSMGGGKILITGRVEQERLVLTVEDNGQGMAEATLHQIRQSLQAGKDKIGIGIGLLNVHQRIQLHYGKTYGLSVSSKLEAGTSVTVTLPLHS